MAQPDPTPIRILGAEGSPYSRKMRSLLRYRRIPHHWVQRNSRDDVDPPKLKVALMPVLVFPDGEAMIDSTFQLRRLEADFSGRSVRPTDPALAFIDFLIEDYADEWLTKAMFHYRWAFEADAAHAGQVLPRWSNISAPEESVQKLSKMFCERQIGRLGVVGSNETTGPLIEASYRRLLGALDAVLRDQPFVLGGRPGSSDFALFGQLTQLAHFDPTPMAVTTEESYRVFTWVSLIEDLSGKVVEEDQWLSSEAIPASVTNLLCEVGRVYAPFLLGNAAAVAAGADRVECEIDGRTWTQKPFPYQAKCLGWLREAYTALGDADRLRVDSILAGTGCEAIVA